VLPCKQTGFGSFDHPSVSRCPNLLGPCGGAASHPGARSISISPALLFVFICATRLIWWYKIGVPFGIVAFHTGRLVAMFLACFGKLVSLCRQRSIYLVAFETSVGVFAPAVAVASGSDLAVVVSFDGISHGDGCVHLFAADFPGMLRWLLPFCGQHIRADIWCGRELLFGLIGQCCLLRLEEGVAR